VSVAEAGHAAQRVRLVQPKVTRLARVAVLPLHVLLAPAGAGVSDAVGSVVGATGRVALTLPAPGLAEVKVVRQTPVTFLAGDARLAFTHPVCVALLAPRSDRVTAALLTTIRGTAFVESIAAALTVWPEGVVATVLAVAAVARPAVKLVVERTASRHPVAVARLALVCIGLCGAPPGLVVVEGQTLVTVRSGGVVLAPTAQLLQPARASRLDALTRVAVTLAPAPYSEVRDGVEVRAKNIGVPKHFVPEGVDSVEYYHDFCGCHPLLEFWAVLEVIRARPALQGAEGHTAPSQRGNVAVIRGAERLSLVAALDDGGHGQAVGLLASSTVVLVRLPRA
jgi:hypothetical protein